MAPIYRIWQKSNSETGNRMLLLQPFQNRTRVPAMTLSIVTLQLLPMVEWSLQRLASLNQATPFIQNQLYIRIRRCQFSFYASY
jgi:hypothetical protein